MKLTKKIAGLGLAVAMMISGLNVISEKAIAAEKSTDKIAVNILVKQNKNSKKVKVSSENIKAHLAYEKILKNIRENPAQFLDKSELEEVLSVRQQYGKSTVIKPGEFAYHDFDGDKIDELIIHIFYGWSGGMYGYWAKDLVYQYKNGKVNKIVNLGPWLFDEIEYDFYRPYVINQGNGGVSLYHDHTEYSKIKNGKKIIGKEITGKNFTIINGEVSYNEESGEWEHNFMVMDPPEKKYPINKFEYIDTDENGLDDRFYWYMVDSKTVDKQTFESEMKKYKSDYKVKFLKNNKANVKKYRKTYNSTSFRELKNRY
jgi:hypothetical protein